jgi:hypothetical protein
MVSDNAWQPPMAEKYLKEEWLVDAITWQLPRITT